MTTNRRTTAHLAPLASFRGRGRTLHLTTFAFFASFVVWFNLAPFAVAIKKDLHLSATQMATLAICNLALAVPARAVVGMLLDRFGPRRLYAALLVLAVIPNTAFAMAHTFDQLVVSRLLLGIVGAGFVVGIRMVSEWFPPDEVGTAEGIYGGWGNFGSAAAALMLPTLALAVATGHGAWRWGVGLSGAAAAIYGVVYFLAVPDGPPGTGRPTSGRTTGLPAATRGGVAGVVVAQLAIPAALGLVAWRIYDANVIDRAGLATSFVAITALTCWLVAKVIGANRAVVRSTADGRATPRPDAVPVAPTVLLSLAYGVTFGAELTMASLLPTFFASTFALRITAAGAAGSAFAFTNLVTRPGGGIVSDLVGSRRRVVRAALLGSAVCFGLLGFLDRSWPLSVGVAAVALTSVFVQGGNGAIFAMVPLVSRRHGGQVAGLAGAYGNIGGVIFSSVLFFTANNVRVVFVVIATAALIAAALCRWLPDPDDQGIDLISAAAEPAISALPVPAAGSPTAQTLPAGDVENQPVAVTSG